jgi:starvation-inducible DNA-binding protein
MEVQLMEEITDPLKIAFADTYALYVKAQNYHWNVEGPMFAMYHDFFGKIYEEVGGAIDPFAEEIRAAGAYAPASFGRFLELTSIEDEVFIIPPDRMVAILYADNAKVLGSLTIARNAAENAKAYGLVNFLEERLDRHQKHAWMLRVSTDV